MAEFNVPITKAGNRTIAVDTQGFSDEIYNLIVAEGLKVVLNAKQSKVKSGKDLTDKEREEFQQMAMELAEKNLEALTDGTYKKGRATAPTDADGKKVDGKTMTEAMRLARNMVRDQLKAEGLKISHYAASDITAAAKDILASDPAIIEEAKANLAKRAEVKPKGVDIKALIKPSPKLVAAAERRKAEAKAERDANKGTLSATQAGRVKFRTKPETHAH